MRAIPMLLVSRSSVGWMMTVLTLTPVVTSNVAQYVAPAMLHVEEKLSALLPVTRQHAPVPRDWRVTHLSRVGRLTVAQTGTAPRTRPATTTTASHRAPFRIPAWVWRSVQWWVMSPTASVLPGSPAAREQAAPRSRWAAGQTPSVPVSWPASTRSVYSPVTWQIPAAVTPSVQCWTLSQ